MTHYYFDVRNGQGLISDEEGMDLPDMTAVEDEAAKSLADFAKDALLREHATDHPMVVEVRDREGPVLKVKFAFEFERQRQS